MAAIVGPYKERIKCRLEEVQIGGGVSTVWIDAGNSLRVERYV
jgi:hypothetical protein